MEYPGVEQWQDKKASLKPQPDKNESGTIVRKKSDYFPIFLILRYIKSTTLYD